MSGRFVRGQWVEDGKRQPALVDGPVIEPRSSFLVEDGEAYQTHPVDAWANRRLYVARRSVGREGQRARIRERIAAHGTTESDGLRATRAELKRRISERKL